MSESFSGTRSYIQGMFLPDASGLAQDVVRPSHSQPRQPQQQGQGGGWESISADGAFFDPPTELGGSAADSFFDARCVRHVSSSKVHMLDISAATAHDREPCFAIAQGLVRAVQIHTGFCSQGHGLRGSSSPIITRTSSHTHLQTLATDAIPKKKKKKKNQ